MTLGLAVQGRLNRVVLPLQAGAAIGLIPQWPINLDVYEYSGKSGSDIDALQLRNSSRLIPVRYKDIGIAINEATVRCAEDSSLDLRRGRLVACPL